IYRQTERLDIYEKYLAKLLESGKAFWCYHTPQELESEKKKQTNKKEAPRHICGHKLQAPRTGHARGVIRLAVDENSKRVISFDDNIRGKIEWQEKLIGDFSLAKDLR